MSQRFAYRINAGRTLKVFEQDDADPAFAQPGCFAKTDCEALLFTLFTNQCDLK